MAAYRDSLLQTKGGATQFERYVIDNKLVIKEGQERSKAVRYYLNSRFVGS